MKNPGRIVSVLILFAVSIIGANAQVQRPPNGIADREVTAILQRLEQSSNRFRGSLNSALVQAHIELRPQNNINSLEPAFERAMDQLRDRFARRIASAADVQHLLQQASLVNGFMTRNRLNKQVQSDWSAVRLDLNALASAYGTSWQWIRQTLPPVNSSRLSRLSNTELDQLITRIETGGDKFRTSLTEAFALSRYDGTSNEANMNDYVRNFKNATVQLRYRFDTRQLVNSDVQDLIHQSAPIDKYMEINRTTSGARNDWSNLRGELNTLVSAFNDASSWRGPEPKTH
jgi:hypothetical protein